MNALSTRQAMFEDALASPEPVWELRGVVRTLLALGAPRDELENELTDYALQLRTTDREREEDAVTEVVDFLVGWCSPFMKL